MRLLTLACACGIAVALLSQPHAARAGADDEAQIKALEDRFTIAFSAKDVDAIMKVYVPDQSLFVFDLVPPRQYVGAAAYRKDWENFFTNFDGPIKFGISDLAIVADGNVGYSHSIQRVTDGYRKIDGHWLVAMEHVSVPVDLETGKPDLQSKP